MLIVAGNASARGGGEAVLPLHYFTGLAARDWPVTLIAHERNRTELQAHLPHLAQHMHFTPDTALQRILWRIGSRMPGAVQEHLFGNLIELVNGWHLRRLIRSEVAAGHVDLVHQPVPVSPAAPSMLFGLGVPVVIGPMNGGMNWPPGYARSQEHLLARAFVALGRRFAGLANRLLPGKRRAAMLLVANARTAHALPTSHPRVVELVENGVDLAVWQAGIPAPPQPGTFRLVFIGRLVRWKALDVTLHALAHAQRIRPDLSITLDVLGDGPERPALEALTGALSLQAQVRFHGFLPQTDCAARLAGADALILNSLRECGGAVVLEAMAMGRPVIASAWGGPADYLDDGCGLLVHPSPPEGFAERLAGAIATLAADPERAARMGQAGAAKVRAQYDWARKLDRIAALYDEVLRYRTPSS